MPAILPSAAAIETWLSDRPWGDDLKRLVRPFEGALECYPVDKGVGKAGNESEDFIKVREQAGEPGTTSVQWRTRTGSATQCYTSPASRASFHEPG